jgi:hypothetical protein
MPTIIPFTVPIDHVGELAFTPSQRLKAIAVRTMFYIPPAGCEEDPELREHYLNVWMQLEESKPVADCDILAAMWLLEIFLVGGEGEMVGEYLDIFYMLQKGFK